MRLQEIQTLVNQMEMTGILWLSGQAKMRPFRLDYDDKQLDFYYGMKPNF